MLIVFSVVLGLYLSERIEEQKQARESKKLFATIQSEVKDNQMLVEEWSQYHEDLHKNLSQLLVDDSFVAAFTADKSLLFDTLLTRGTFMHRFPASDAWDIAKSHPLIINIDYEALLALSKIYNQQAATFEPLFEMIALMDSRDVNAAHDAKANLQTIAAKLKEIVGREKLLLQYYKNAEAALNL